MLSQLREGQKLGNQLHRIFYYVFLASAVLIVILMIALAFQGLNGGVALDKFPVQPILVITVLITVISYLLYLMWLYRAYDNLRFVGDMQVKTIPIWVVIWNLIPIYNIQASVRVLYELWNRSYASNIEPIVYETPQSLYLWSVSLWGLVIFVFYTFLGDSPFLFLIFAVLYIFFAYHTIRMTTHIQILQNLMQYRRSQS